ncbi:MAG: hypothetical protein ACRCVJ_18790 [Clostridium sp.]|uniref:hypothetical protein n=1 Tax=Clostridium sp. TaxID=1506 RepID=UPI003F32E683
MSIYNDVKQLVILDHATYDNKVLDSEIQGILKYLISINTRISKKKAKYDLSWKEKHKRGFHEGVKYSYADIIPMEKQLVKRIDTELFSISSITKYQHDEVYKGRVKGYKKMKVDLFKILTLYKLIEVNLYNENVNKEIIKEYNELVLKYSDEIEGMFNEE